LADLTEHVQMKRRGFMPNVRTYATMMSGYANVDDWGSLTKQLELVHSIYGQLKQHLERARNAVDEPAGDSGTPFILYPIALYISILGKAGKYQRAFDVFHELDTDGPLAPDPKIYSSLLGVLADRACPVSADAAAAPDPEAVAQSVSEAKYVWRRHMRSLDKQPLHAIEPRAVDAMVKILSRGTPSDHELMFDILRDVCGLPRPGEQPSQQKKQKKQEKVPPTVWIISETLDGCIAAGRPDVAVHYAQSVMDTHRLRPILCARHLHKLLRAHILLAKQEGEKNKEEGKDSPSPSPSESSSRAENAAAWVEWMLARVRSKNATPNEHSLVYALELCYRCRDMPSALRIARAMLGSGVLHVHGAGGSPPVKVWAWEYLFRLAATASPDEQRQCLELLDQYGSSVLDVWESRSAVERMPHAEKKTNEYLARHILQVVQTVLPSPDHEGTGDPDAAGHKAWSDIQRRAETFLKRTRGRKG
jgi:hypothetical protein